MELPDSHNDSSNEAPQKQQQSSHKNSQDDKGDTLYVMELPDSRNESSNEAPQKKQQSSPGNTQDDEGDTVATMELPDSHYILCGEALQKQQQSSPRNSHDDGEAPQKQQQSSPRNSHDDWGVATMESFDSCYALSNETPQKHQQSFRGNSYDDGGVATMESPDSRYASSNEAQQKQQQSSPRDSHDADGVEGDYTEKTTYIRFLVSNAEAGSVIGKGGSTISEFQSQSGARIQLSRNYEFFPGTSDRIIMVSGTVNNVLKGVELILDKLLNEFSLEEGDADPRSKVRLVVPNSSCGGIIGKGGATIKSFIEESQAGIKISPQDNSYGGISDRLVTVAGTIEEQMRAIELILSKLSEDSYYIQSMSTPFPYAGYNAANYGPNGGGGKFQNSRPHNNKGPGVLQDDRSSNSVTIGVADEHIGLVLGRGGRNVIEISQVSGARIKISDRDDFLSGTTDRKVTITGSQRAIHIAEDMITQKVSSATDRGE